MEEHFQQVTNIINELAAQNPYITKEQVSKARSMYNGDTRPIEVIRAELEAYSAQIEAQGKKREKDAEKMKGMKGPEKEPPKPVPAFPLMPVTFYHPEENVEIPRDGEVEPEELTPESYRKDIMVVPTYTPENIVPFPTYTPEDEILDSLRVELPGEDKQKALQSMIDEALGEPSTQFETEHSHEQTVASKGQAKVLIRQQNEQASNSSDSSSSEAGYGNVTALLSLTIICSLITIIIALLTILAN